MRKSRIILLILFISLSFAVFKAMGEEGNHYIIDQTAVVKDSISDAGSDWSPIIVTEGVAPELAAQGAFTPSAVAEADQQCGAGVGMREGLASYLNSSEVLFERKAEGRWPIASITKLMTAIVATELGMAEQDFVLTDAMVKTEGDAGGFKTGELFTGSGLLAAMLLSSSNDAAEAFAQSYGRDAFIRRMNVKAQELRMLSTHYVDPSGLSPLNQSTPSDLYKLAGYLHATHPDILKVSRQRKATIVDLNTNRKRIVTTINEFAGQATFLGGKTGYIVEAEGNGNLLSVFMYNGQPFTIIVLGSPDRFGETKTLLKCI